MGTEEAADALLHGQPTDLTEEDELLHREVERLLEMWDDEPSFQKLKKGGRGWS